MSRKFRPLQTLRRARRLGVEVIVFMMGYTFAIHHSIVHSTWLDASDGETVESGPRIFCGVYGTLFALYMVK